MACIRHTFGIASAARCLQVGQVDSRAEVLYTEEALRDHGTDGRISARQIAPERHRRLVSWSCSLASLCLTKVASLVMLGKHLQTSVQAAVLSPNCCHIVLLLLMRSKAFCWGPWNHRHDHQVCAVSIQGGKRLALTNMASDCCCCCCCICSCCACTL